IFLQLYGAFFDAQAGRARPIAELVQELESGRRPVRWNRDAAEITPSEKARDLGAWSALDKAMKRRVIDSYRIAYRAEQGVNWSSRLGTARANEEVIDGRSERGGFPVLRKPLKQWMFRITAYADRLLAGLGEVDWPESTKLKQTGWIGK